MTITKTKTDARVHNARVHDALRWVAQEARALVMSGHSSFGSRNDEKLRAALKALACAYAADD